ncbi:teichoic acid transport system ATP-binding protein [Weissella uvarum]|uniref:ABC transporter ATP-binding protein n=1 Tax=Weissella uvarum TaxID=1479233 RepID=UPI001961432C|nr:ABC transporter ATP-binding protein [Weissella uvarum]MBM7616578.1 teichoic acid transport system ATP-binding protein [Weissella uvarum]MCM0594962.1 ABC transporter ATP-binding protein [Weissella uvarum]
MSEDDKKIVAKQVTKRFELETSSKEKIKNLFKPASQKDDNGFWSLKGVSFEVGAGEAIGVVGLNGSGKSTLLNVVSGIFPQTTGDVEINGDTSIISIGAGLKMNLTGRNNIEFKLLMMNFNHKQIKELMPQIIEFSELGDFIDQPVKSYSSGMRSKLGFSIMAFTDPDIMIIDEALSVGDSTFASKSFDKIREFKKQGKTIFFVSHSNAQVKEIADKIIWMHYGELREFGPTDEVMPHYEAWQKDFKQKSQSERDAYVAEKKKAQREFSYTDAATQQVDEELAENPNAKQFDSEADKESYIQKLAKKMAKRGGKLRFGWINLLVVIALFVGVGYATYDTLTEAHQERVQTQQRKEQKAKQKREAAKKESSKTDANTMYGNSSN